MDLSVIIPVYNVEAYIGKCLDSVVQMAENDLTCEIIVVNDGTPDHSMDVVEAYRTRYSNIKIVNQKNQGLGAARNRGLKEAKGEYVYFLDSDDYIDYKAFCSLFDKGRMADTDVIVGDLWQIVDGVKKDVSYKIKTEVDILANGNDFFAQYYRSCINTVVVRSIYKRNFLINHNLLFSEHIFFEDTNWTPKVLLTADSVLYSPIVFYYYVIRDGSIIQTDFSEKKMDDSLFVFEDLLKHAEGQSSGVQKELGYIAVIGIFVAIGRYLRSHKMNTSKKKEINVILGLPCIHYPKIKSLLIGYRFLPNFFNTLFKKKYSIINKGI